MAGVASAKSEACLAVQNCRPGDRHPSGPNMKTMIESDSGIHVGARSGPGLYGWYVTFALMLCATLSFLDSQLPYILVESIKADLKLTDTEIGFIGGPAFSFTYAICALPIAKLSDRTVRKSVICVAIVVWSTMTAAAALAQGFATFAFSRVGVALGESALTPAANSIISDNTTPNTRPIAIAIYTLGAPIGAALALGLGGIINDRYGWRMALVLVGGVGVILSLLVGLTVREPIRRGDAGSGDLPKGDLRSLLSDPTMRHILLGGSLTGLSFGAIGSWGPAYVMRTFHLPAAQVGPAFGGALGVVGIIGMLAGGFTAGWLATRRPGAAFRWVALFLVVATGAQFAGLVATSFGVFLVFTALSTLCITFYSAPTLAAVQALVDPSARSFAAAVTLFCISGIGLASGTFLTGFLSDQLRPEFGADSLRWALLIPTFARLWAAAHYYLAARSMERAGRVRGNGED